MRFASLVLGVLAAVGSFGQARNALEISHRERSLQPGELVVVTVRSEAPVTGVRVAGLSQVAAAWQVEAHTWQALIGIDLDTQPGEHDVTAKASGTTVAMTTITTRLTVLPRRFRTRTLRVDPDFVNPPTAVRARIDADVARLDAVWAGSAATRLWTRGFVAPVPHQANSAFGTRSVFNGEPRNAHGGTDFLSPAGTRVRAPAAGRVVLVQDLYFSGNTVIVDHGLGLLSFFGHLSAFDVVEGASVQPGTVLGRVGATGRVTGAHLHWTVRLNGARVDPLGLVALLPPS